MRAQVKSARSDSRAALRSVSNHGNGSSGERSPARTVRTRSVDARNCQIRA